MKQRIANVTLVVGDYDEAIAFYTGKLNFDLIEDTPLTPSKRWVLVAPKGSSETRLLLAKAEGVTFIRPPEEQPYGIVAVFEDLYGNQWDLLQPAN